MYKDYWIKTTDETTWLTQAQDAGVLIKSTDFEGKEILVPAPDYAVDVIGTIDVKAAELILKVGGPEMIPQ